ncbi:MAG: polysaccharide biosynthesis C-terminal domain-containing protein [Lachnospiraceae bacterium]|nr:polysaccharide biosynthesis C-terminal domain-containing protein [Lachnospiraceae bacterium]
MNKSRYLLKNMSLFTLSNIASKLLVFLLVPFYTNVLTESDYGIADVMQATLLLLVPLISVNAGEAALRYGIEEKDKRGSILKSGLRHVIMSVGIVFALCIIAYALPFAEGYGGYFILFGFLYACNAFYEFMLLYTQGSEKVEIMILGSVSCTAITIAANLIMLLVFDMGLYGYLFSQMAAFLTSAVIMFVLLHGGELIGATEDRLLRQEMTVYGRNMMLYSTASWANNALDRYFILFMLGTFQNGLYGVAYKIPAILMVFQRIFAQSFQMSATKSYKEKDAGVFFGNLFDLYNAVMLIGCGGILLILRPLAAFMFQKGFFAAWVMVPPLLISVIFGALEGYLGSICLAHKDGKSMGIATGIGALVNIILNYLLIIRLGAIGAAYATLVSYSTMFVIAYLLTGRHVDLLVDIKRDTLGYLLILLAGGITMYPGLAEGTGELQGKAMLSLGAYAWTYCAVAVIIVLLIALYRKQILFVKRRFFGGDHT